MNPQTPDHLSTAELVRRAAHSSQSAWSSLVRRHQPLVYGVCRRYGLTGWDADDITGAVWLQLVRRLTMIREPATLPGWLATTTRNECLSHLRHHSRQVFGHDQEIDTEVDPTPDAGLLSEERWSALRKALADVPERDRKLLFLLFSDPPLSYAEISTRLKIPIGSIGPNRQRCLARIRQNNAIASLLPSRTNVDV
jgi:RNA polymerase sigma factor (sigma-70 family)